MEQTKQLWYIVQQQNGTCQVVSFREEQTKTPKKKQWGSFSSKQEAIAKKIGLIRAGKCQPE